MMKIKKMNLLITLLLLAVTFNIHKTHAMKSSDPQQILLELCTAPVTPETLAQFESLCKEANVDLDLIYPDINGTLLMLATEGNNYPIIQILLDNGANINKANFAGDTALMIATYLGYTDAVQCLLKNPHIMINKQDNTGCTALMLAAQKNNCPIIQTLFKHGASVNIATSNGGTALMTAAYTGGMDAVQCLLNNPHIMINQQDNKRWTALMLAAENNNCPMIKILLDNGADINMANVNGATALMIAVNYESTDAVQCLLNDPNIKINQQDKEGNTTLMLAILDKNKVIIKQLLDAGADPEIANNAGLTPRNAAININILEGPEGYDPATASMRTVPIEIEADAEIQSLIHKAILKKHGVVNPFIEAQK